jgi:hypothetical protein
MQRSFAGSGNSSQFFASMQRSGNQLVAAVQAGMGVERFEFIAYAR